MRAELIVLLALGALGCDDGGAADEDPPSDAASVDAAPVDAALDPDADPTPDADLPPDAGPTPDAGADAAVEAPQPLRVVSMNIGNGDETDPHYALRLSDQAYEDFVGSVIQGLDADIIALQEVLPPGTCADFEEADPARTCFDAENRMPAVVRLLGPAYAVVCDGRRQVECVGVSNALGTMRDVAVGDSGLPEAETPELPAPGCRYAEGTCNETNCDDESTISAFTVDTDRGALRVIHLHPNASGVDANGQFYFGKTCRKAQVEQAFELVDPNGRNLLLGDWNLDPGSPLYREEAAIWDAHIGPDLRFRDHDERTENGRRVPTIPSIAVAIDHVVSDFATGTCEVRDDPRFDAAFDFSALPEGEAFPGRVDHFPIVCPLVW